MSKAVAIARLTSETAQQRSVELATSIIVLACASALIFAGEVLPF